MLSFMKDQNSDNLASGTAMPGQSGQGADFSSDDDFIVVPTQTGSLQKSTIVLAVLFVIGAVCLWYMISKTTPQAASAEPVLNEEVEMEVAITRLTGVNAEMLSRMDEIVGKFYEFSNVMQVGVEELAKNPFELQMYLGSVDDKEDEVISAIQAAMMLRQKIQQKVDELQLLSIMRSGEKYCCLINDRILNSGDMIGEFKVGHIGENNVELLWGSETALNSDNTNQLMKFVLKFKQ